MPGSRGEVYLHQRGIPLALAQQLGVGYATPGTWPHAARDWRGGRVVFPHTMPDGSLVNLYGRAVGTAAQVPKAKRHDHLPGAKGYCNAACLPPPSSSRRRVHQLMPRSRSRSSACSRTLRSPCPRPSSGSISRVSRWNSPARVAASVGLRATPVPGP